MNDGPLEKIADRISPIPQNLAEKEFALDKCIGRRLREKRTALNYSQSVVAKRTGVTYQQIQKYESGENRISASRLWLIANILGVEITYFLEKKEKNAGAPNRDTKEMHHAANDIADDRLKAAIMGIIDIAKKMPGKG